MAVTKFNIGDVLNDKRGREYKVIGIEYRMIGPCGEQGSIQSFKGDETYHVVGYEKGDEDA